MKSVKDVRAPKVGRYVRFVTKDNVEHTGKVTTHTTEGCVLDTGAVFSYDKGDRITWYGASQPAERLPVAEGKPTVRHIATTHKRIHWFLRLMIIYATVASTAALAVSAHVLLK